LDETQQTFFSRRDRRGIAAENSETLGIYLLSLV